MKRILISIATLILTCQLCSAEIRTWTSATGQKISAEIVSYDQENSTVTIKKKKRCKVKHFSFPGGHQIAPPDLTEQAMRWIAEAEE